MGAGELENAGCLWQLGTNRRWFRVTKLRLSVLLLLLIGMVSSLHWAAGWLAQPPRVDHVDAIVVLGGDYPQRNLHGISLYLQGFAPELWYTGHEKHSDTEESLTKSAVELAIKKGVPADAIHLLHTTSTWEDGQQIRAYAEERRVNSVLVVTSWYHGRRALCVIGRHLEGSGVSVFYDAASSGNSGTDEWWRNLGNWEAVLKELIKFGLYWPRYGLAPWNC